jgi:hypothetical protein
LFQLESVLCNFFNPSDNGNTYYKVVRVAASDTPYIKRFDNLSDVLPNTFSYLTNDFLVVLYNSLYMYMFFSYISFRASAYLLLLPPSSILSMMSYASIKWYEQCCCSSLAKSSTVANNYGSSNDFGVNAFCRHYIACIAECISPIGGGIWHDISLMSGPISINVDVISGMPYWSLIISSVEPGFYSGIGLSGLVGVAITG